MVSKTRVGLAQPILCVWVAVTRFAPVQTASATIDLLGTSGAFSLCPGAQPYVCSAMASSTSMPGPLTARTARRDGKQGTPSPEFEPEPHFAAVSQAQISTRGWALKKSQTSVVVKYRLGTKFVWSMLVLWFRHMVPIRRPSKFARLGAWRAVMLEHHKRRATTPGGLEDRPTGRVSRPLGASDALDDGWPSPAPALLPRERETRSYGYHMSEPEHWDRDRPRSPGWPGCRPGAGKQWQPKPA
jgi:hypothetical protein